MGHFLVVLLQNHDWMTLKICVVFIGHYARHTFSCWWPWIEWIHAKLYKLASGHWMWDGRTDRRQNEVKPIYRLDIFVVGYNKHAWVKPPCPFDVFPSCWCPWRHGMKQYITYGPVVEFPVFLLIMRRVWAHGGAADQPHCSSSLAQCRVCGSFLNYNDVVVVESGPLIQ